MAEETLLLAKLQELERQRAKKSIRCEELQEEMKVLSAEISVVTNELLTLKDNN